MTIEEYLTDVKRIYYQLSVVVKGKQLLANGSNLLLLDGDVERLTDIRDDRGRLGRIRFVSLALPAATEISETGSDHAIINYGNAHLVIWPIKETSDDVQRDSTSDPGP